MSSCSPPTRRNGSRPPRCWNGTDCAGRSNSSSSGSYRNVPITAESLSVHPVSALGAGPRRIFPAIPLGAGRVTPATSAPAACCRGLSDEGCRCPSGLRAAPKPVSTAAPYLSPTQLHLTHGYLLPNSHKSPRATNAVAQLGWWCSQIRDARDQVALKIALQASAQQHLSDDRTSALPWTSIVGPVQRQFLHCRFVV